MYFRCKTVSACALQVRVTPGEPVCARVWLCVCASSGCVCVFIRVHVDVCAFVPHDTGNVTMRRTGHVHVLPPGLWVEKK